MANCHAKEILSCMPQCDLGSGVSEVDLVSDPSLDSKTLGLTWDPENDTFHDPDVSVRQLWTSDCIL